MSGHEFGSVYARTYDNLYQDKDYQAECDLLQVAFQTYAAEPVKSILDLGCGTGNHAIPLSQRGFTVVGVDRSAFMLESARKKAGLMLDQYAAPVFQEGDVRDVTLGKTFDAVLLMFAVLGYQYENSDVLATLRNAHRHLKPHGLLILDVWYGPAVLAQRPGDRLKIIPTEKGKLLRAASGSLDIYHHLCSVSYRVWEIDGDHLVTETEETHQMRYFFPQELKLFLDLSGYRLLSLSAFPSLSRVPDETSWNVLCIANAED